MQFKSDAPQLSDEERRTFNTLLRALDKFCEIDPDMPLSYVRTFLAIAMNNGSTLKDLREILGLEQSTMSRNVAALSPRHRRDKDGYDLVSVRVLPENQRFKCVMLNGKGRSLVRDVQHVLGVTSVK